MTGHHANQRGVTLIELLIAITLLSLLSTGMLFAIRVGLNSLGKTNRYFTEIRRVLGVDRVIAEQIAGYIPVAGLCAGGDGVPPRFVIFFQGDPQTMRFVSSYSLNEAARGLPRILEYQVVPGENGTGVRLIVNETLYTGPGGTLPFCGGFGPDPLSGVLQPLWRPVTAGPQSFVLADKLSHCQFTYKEATDLARPDLWHSHWVRDFVPAAVHIDWAPLDPDPSRLHVPPVTLPFRPTRNPLNGLLQD